jgi:hypothetical protein
LKSTKTENQLTKKEQLAKNADKKSTERKLAIIKKLGKQGN